MIPLSSRLGREVPNEQSPDLPPARAEHTVAAFGRQYPLAELRRPPTGQYNCHGLTLANRRTSINSVEHVQAILEDDGYRKIRARDVCLGDLAVYYDGREIAHTGLVVKIIRQENLIGGQAVWVLSKWGTAAEYIHPARHAPYQDGELIYWTDRPLQ
ncbi:MAG: hypothetical protein IMZ55_16315 [Acidobacteria bacterium]|nr:hypothetical protein [Acidobacteriota bacterium]